jgi:predicted acylesterase/phospholipase RssA
MPALRPRLFQWPDLTWQHLAGSCAVPLFLKPHRLDGRYHSDGGLLEPCPVWAAVEMGATRIISVNLLRQRPLFVRTAVRVARLCGGYTPSASHCVELIEIAPDRRLGTARDSMYWSRHNAERWIEWGEQDAGRVKHLVVECLEQAG